MTIHLPVLEAMAEGKGLHPLTLLKALKNFAGSVTNEHRNGYLAATKDGVIVNAKYFDFVGVVSFWKDDKQISSISSPKNAAAVIEAFKEAIEKSK